MLLPGLAQLYPEFKPMVNFFKSLRQAIQIQGDTTEYIVDKFSKIQCLSEPYQVLTILDIFVRIYENREFRTIGMPLVGDNKESRTNIRLHLIDKIIAENYTGKISLRNVASAIGMSPTAFCNAFKAMTGTTFNRYLTAYRMRIASRLLRESALNIGEIGYRMGIQHISHGHS